MASEVSGALDPVSAIALVGAVGVGAQWLAWRLRVPGIVLMLLAGVLIGPVFGLFDPERDIGPLTSPMISIAVAVILFEGGMTLNVHNLKDAVTGVRRLVVIGAPLGWLMSTLTLHYAAGLGWQSSAVFGGIMIVTGPTVIAPLLRAARLSRRPATLLQWEAIVNDPLGALAAVLAFSVVMVLNEADTFGSAMIHLGIGVVFSGILGAGAGAVITHAFLRALVPEYMKVPVLFVVLLSVFALSDRVLHESGLLAVTIMGLVIANANLPSYEELRRFKEHATILLVSGVFILLAASLDFTTLAQLNWQAGLFVVVTILVARPGTVLLSLLGTDIPIKERILVAFTGPRGVVLVAVAGLFGTRLADLGVEDGAILGPLAFVLVAVTVVLHGFTLAPFARWLGLTASGTPGVLFVGASRFSIAFAEALKSADIPVRVTETSLYNLRRGRDVGLPLYYGDVLAEEAEHRLHMVDYGTLIASTANDAYNTLVTTELAPEFGRNQVYQVTRYQGENSRHALPATLGGRHFAEGQTYGDLETLMLEGWRFRKTGLTDEFAVEDWKHQHPTALRLGVFDPDGVFHVSPGAPKADAGWAILALAPPKPAAAAENNP
ncbi:MAG: sodium:proton antiporter [Pseudoruegeria sp.]